MKKQKGFSLIELMVVVAVIGALTAVAVPQYQNYVKKAEAAAALATLSALKINIEDYIATNGAFPDGSTAGQQLTDMGSASDVFNAGTLSIANPSTSAGELVMTFGGTGSALGASHTLTLKRDTVGKWICSTDGANFTSATKPKGCA